MISFQSFLRITKSVKVDLHQSQNSVYLLLFLSLISLFFSYLVIYSDFLFEIKMGFLWHYFSIMDIQGAGLVFKRIHKFSRLLNLFLSFLSIIQGAGWVLIKNWKPFPLGDCPWEHPANRLGVTMSWVWTIAIIWHVIRNFVDHLLDLTMFYGLVTCISKSS